MVGASVWPEAAALAVGSHENRTDQLVRSTGSWCSPIARREFSKQQHTSCCSIVPQFHSKKRSCIRHERTSPESEPATSVPAQAKRIRSARSANDGRKEHSSRSTAMQAILHTSCKLAGTERSWCRIQVLRLDNSLAASHIGHTVDRTPGAQHQEVRSCGEVRRNAVDAPSTVGLHLLHCQEQRCAAATSTQCFHGTFYSSTLPRHQENRTDILAAYTEPSCFKLFPVLCTSYNLC